MNPVLLVLAITIFIFYLFRVATKRPPNFPPGPPSLPVYGAYWLLLLVNYNYVYKAVDYFAKRYRTKVLGFFLGPYATVVACDKESLKEVFTKPELQGRIDNFVIRDRQLGKVLGFFLIDGPLWKYQRRFTLRHMRDYGFGCRSAKQESLVQQQVQDILDIFGGRKQDSGIFKNGHAFVPTCFCHVFLNSLWDMFCGEVYTDKEHGPSQDLMNIGFTFHRNTDAMGNALGITDWLRHIAPTLSGCKGMRFANGEMLKQLQKSIDEHLATYSEDHMRDFTDVFIREMKANEGSPSEFTAEQLLIVGLDLLLPTLTTVNAVLAFYVQCLLLYPCVQKKIQEELDRVVGRDRLPVLDDRCNLPYTEATLREVMRYKAILPLGVAHKALEDTTLGGYFVPKGAMVLTSLYSYHHDPEIWGDPENFRPERFLDEEGHLLKKDLSVPFGAGIRLCAGETFARNTMFLIMSGVLQNFSFVGPVKDLDPINGLVVGPKEFWAQVQPRT